MALVSFLISGVLILFFLLVCYLLLCYSYSGLLSEHLHKAAASGLLRMGPIFKAAYLERV